MIRRYKKKPVVVEAEQYLGQDMLAVCECEVTSGTAREPYLIGPHVHTIEGPLHVTVGDWIITGVRGEKYPCKPDVFAATYEAVEEPS